MDKIPYQLFNIGNANSDNLEHFIIYLEKTLGLMAKRNYLPMQEGDTPETHAYVSKLAAYIGFKPNAQIEEGVENLWSGMQGKGDMESIMNK